MKNENSSGKRRSLGDIIKMCGLPSSEKRIPGIVLKTFLSEIVLKKPSFMSSPLAKIPQKEGAMRKIILVVIVTLLLAGCRFQEGSSRPDACVMRIYDIDDRKNLPIEEALAIFPNVGRGLDPKSDGRRTHGLT
ncbi:hypothetical protein NDS46_03590 [Paenibacillus thiaminolyticus]|uniref:hypothetical protein n=1 Tax=Paenibacillus thiaminolyticus TaxID=49283 RepID=UPI00232C5C43|nr:hypothetical protein [Paenibacillus thiaminolyticus]WCF09004.1 hypothetical protein NDS46_03590 [Paenibacillus thiaminolyticus]